MPVLEAKGPLAQSIQSLAANGEGKSIKDFMKGRSDNYKLNPFDIVIEPGFNARDVTAPGTLEHIDNLAVSIKAIGLQKSLKVRMKNGVPVLLDGECRLRAVIRAIEVYGAEIRTVDCRLADKTISDAEATLSLVVENSGRDLNPLEKADVFKRLVSYGWSINDIAERAGVSSVRVTQLIETTGVPDAVKDMIRNGEIAPTLAWSVAKDNDFDAERTIAAIAEAQQAAQSKGRKKVTARHVKGTKTNFRSTLSNVLAGASVEDIGEDGYVVVFSREQFNQLQALTKVDFAIRTGAEAIEAE